MGNLSLSPDQLDAMQEITNIGMGQAGSVLAELLDSFITLSVPRINILALAEVSNSIAALVGEDIEVTAVRQSFQGFVTGEAIVVYGVDGCKELADLMGYDSELNKDSETELLLDVGNVLVGACLGGIIDQLKEIAYVIPGDDDVSLTFSAPLMMAEAVPANTLIKAEKLAWTHALLLEVNFSLEERNFISHVCVLMPEASL